MSTPPTLEEDAALMSVQADKQKYVPNSTKLMLKMQCRTIVDSSHSNHSVFVNHCIRLDDNELWALICPTLATTNSSLLAN
eukprot:scaffold50088_cov49-Cyclotella_meneghiniana.AAC.3